MNTEQLFSDGIFKHLTFAVNTVIGEVGIKLTAGIGAVACTYNQALLLAGKQVGTSLQFTRFDYPAARQKYFDLVERNRADRLFRLLYTDARAQLGGAWYHFQGAFNGKARLAIQVHQLDQITRENQVRVFDLGVNMPNLWPEPGTVQKGTGNIPKGIPFFDGIFVGVTRFKQYIISPRKE